MLRTQSPPKPNPSMLAAQIAKRNAKATKTAEPKPAPQPAKPRKPYTTQSAGYEVKQVLPAPPVEEFPVIETETHDTEEVTSADWMLGADELGLDWTPRLRRSTIIDPLDPTEALDRTPEFLGFHVVEW